MVYIRRGTWTTLSIPVCSSQLSYIYHMIQTIGTVTDKPGPVTALIRWLQKILDVIALFFKTIFDPAAARDMIERQQSRQRHSTGYKIGGSSGTERRGPRIAGLSDFKDAGGNCAAGA